MKRRVYKKRISRLKKFWIWQKKYIAGHNYRWTLAAKGKAGYGTLKGLNLVEPEKHHSLKSFRKDWEKKRLTTLWGMRFYYKAYENG